MKPHHRRGPGNGRGVESLKKTALFASLTSEELRRIEGKISLRHFKKNEIILDEEHANEYMYIIIDGAVKVIQTTEDGKEILFTMHGTGDFFGELSLIDGKTAPAAVLATRDSVAALIAKEDFFSLLYSQNKLLRNLLGILCARLRESWKKIEMMNLHNASNRVKMLLLLLAKSIGEGGEEGIVLNMKLIHQDIADMTGLSRETVTRVLDRWKKSGEIRVLRNKCIQLTPEFESIPL